MATTALFKPIKVGRLTLQHPVVLAPLTRYRTYGLLQASYYSQRGSIPGTLLITEATFISHDTGGYGHVPGIYAGAQVRGWNKVTDAVHAKASVPGKTGSAFTAEIKDHIAAYAKAASNAVHGAGFDGAETHNANGYLPDQFLRTASNKPTDRWGVDEEGRTRFTKEVVDAVSEDRVSIGISPWSAFQDMRMPDPRPTFAYLVTALRDKHPKMAYLYVIEPRVPGNIDVAPNPDENNDFLREIWNGGELGEEYSYQLVDIPARQHCAPRKTREGLSPSGGCI